MRADAVIVLEAGNMNLPPAWFKPGAFVFSFDPTYNTGTIYYTVSMFTVHALYKYVLQVTLNAF